MWLSAEGDEVFVCFGIKRDPGVPERLSVLGKGEDGLPLSMINIFFFSLGQ